MQKQIIQTLCVQPQIDPKEEVRKTINFLKEYLIEHPFLKGFVLGISGGQDSTLVGRLAQLAVEELRCEKEKQDYQFVAVRLPYGVQNDELDAQAALDFIQPDCVKTVNIKEATDALVVNLQNQGVDLSYYHQGNVKARQRMVVQYALAGQLGLAVLGTDHAAEAVTGFYTKYGDGAADLMPLWRLTKSQGRELLKVLEAPENLIYKVPTADLEDDKPLIADEDALGVSYEAIDAYLTGQRISDKEAEIIESWYRKTEHKRHLPITIFDDFWKPTPQK